MRLPKLLLKFTQVMERPAVQRFFARWSIGVGALGMLVIFAMAIGHYVYGTPVRDTDTGQFATTGEVLGIFLLLGGACALCIIEGARRLRRMRDLN